MTDKPSILIIQYGNLIRIEIPFSAATAGTESRTGGCQKNDSLVRTVRSIESSTVLSFQIRLDRWWMKNMILSQEHLHKQGISYDQNRARGRKGSHENYE